MTKPIYDDPNHRSYGIVRRIHLIVLYLYGDDVPFIEMEIGEPFDRGLSDNYEGPRDWTDHVDQLYHVWGYGERQIARVTLGYFHDAARRLHLV